MVCRKLRVWYIFHGGDGSVDESDARVDGVEGGVVRIMLAFVSVFLRSILV